MAVERLTEAGAIVLGKSNVPLLASDWQSYNAAAASTTTAPPNSMLPSPCSDH